MAYAVHLPILCQFAKSVRVFYCVRQPYPFEGVLKRVTKIRSVTRTARWLHHCVCVSWASLEPLRLSLWTQGMQTKGFPVTPMMLCPKGSTNGASCCLCLQVGWVVFGGVRHYKSEESFLNDALAHCVMAGSPFGWKPGAHNLKMFSLYVCVRLLCFRWDGHPREHIIGILSRRTSLPIWLETWCMCGTFLKRPVPNILVLAWWPWKHELLHACSWLLAPKTTEAVASLQVTRGCTG